MSAPRAPAARWRARSSRARSQAVVALPMKEGRPMISSGIGERTMRVLDRCSRRTSRCRPGRPPASSSSPEPSRPTSSRRSTRAARSPSGRPSRRASAKAGREPRPRGRDAAQLAHQLDRDRELQRRGRREAGARVPGRAGSGAEVLDEDAADSRESGAPGERTVRASSCVLVAAERRDRPGVREPSPREARTPGRRRVDECRPRRRSPSLGS